MLPAALTPADVMAGKREEYLQLRSGDHRPNRSQHFPAPKQKKHGTATATAGVGGVGVVVVGGGGGGDLSVKVARGTYFVDGPPRLTWRQAELYGLTPYGEAPPGQDAEAKAAAEGWRYQLPMPS